MGKFNINSLYYVDGYKISHKQMLAPNTTKLYGTWIPRTIKRAPKGINKIVSFGQQLVWKWIHDEFEENFFFRKELIEKEHPFTNYYSLKERALSFTKDMSLYIGMEYDGSHFEELWDLGYLPIKVKSLPEGIQTDPNIPHMTFVNTVDGFAWLTLFLETIVSSLAWKPATSATISLQYKRMLIKWVLKTDPNNAWLIPYLCHDFSARGLSPWDMISSGLGHSTSFKGSDTLAVIPAARYFYNEPENIVSINSVNASEHSVTCTGIFYYESLLKKGKLNNEIEWYYSFDLPCEGSIDNPDYLSIAECLNLRDWLIKFPKGILSSVDDTMNLWKKITHVYARLKPEIMSREGKLVCRPDSGNPVDIITGLKYETTLENTILNSSLYLENNKLYTVDYDYDEVKDLNYNYRKNNLVCDNINEIKGVVELLWDIFGGTINEQGYKILDQHVGTIYGDSINLDRQTQIYERLESKGFAVTNVVLGIGSFTYQYNTRDTFGFAAKGSWFEIVNSDGTKNNFDIYKNPITDDGTKKSLRGLCMVDKKIENNNIFVKTECTIEEEDTGLLQIIYEDGKFYNQTSLEDIRIRLDNELKLELNKEGLLL